MWIFLDIDGVLVPERQFEKSIAREDLLKFDPVCLRLLEEILKAHPEVMIGITSSWRDLFSLEKVKSFFSEKIASMIVGFTPLLDSENDEVYEYYRHKEVEEFLKIQNAARDKWIAINNSRNYYPSETNVVVTDGYNGFDESAASRLEEYLSAVETENIGICAV